MTTTLGPHIPKSGWLLRWTLQASELVFRSPGGMLVFGGIALLASLPTIAMIAIMNEAGAKGLAAYHAADLIAVPLSIVTMAMGLNQVMHADLGEARAIRKLMANSLPVIKNATVISFVLTMLSMAVAGPVVGVLQEVNGSPQGMAPPVNDLKAIDEILHFMTNSAFRGLTAACIFSLFSLGAIVATDMTGPEMSAMSAAFTAKARLLHVQIFTVYVVLVMTLAMLPAIVALPAGYFLLAFIYVSAREVIGGIDGNGKRQESATANDRTVYNPT